MWWKKFSFIGNWFNAEYQDDIVTITIVRKLSDLICERNIWLSKAKELLCSGKIDDNGNADINWKSLQDEFINVERGDIRKTPLIGLKLRRGEQFNFLKQNKKQAMKNDYSENMQNWNSDNYSFFYF